MAVITDHISIPGWARGITWYQIMPERFRNGDPNNTPSAADQKYAWPHDHTSPLERHPWGADWYRLQPWERRNGHDIWFNIQRRRYGGDLLGIIDQLDYLQDLGIGALYLNPMFQAPSHHKYDAASYHHVDPAFGPDPDGDRALIARETPHDPSTWNWTSADELLLQLIENVHRRDMYIILDGVLNHMGLASWVYRDILKNQQDSAFRDWMTVESWANDTGKDHAAAGRKRTVAQGTHAAANIESGSTSLTGLQKELHNRYGKESPFRPGFRIRAWEGFLELPEWRQDRRGIVDGPRQYIFDITRRWMDPYGNGDTFNGVDGWRLDVAYCIKHPFWKAWRKHVHSINPEAYLVAEVIDTVKKTCPYVKGDEFDAVMNYNFQFACNEFFIWNRDRISATRFAQKLEELMTDFPESVPHVMQNLLGSHDTDRVASRIVNRGIGGGRSWWDYFRRSRAENPEYDTRKPSPEERCIQQLMILMQFTYPGAPLVYYGDEAGMWGANDPCCRKPMVWPDIAYEDEALLPDGTPRPEPDTVFFDSEMHGFYRSLIRLRNERPALKYGDYKTLQTDDDNGVVVFRRRYSKPGEEVDEVLVAIHNGEGETEVEVDVDVPLPDHQTRETDTKRTVFTELMRAGGEGEKSEKGDEHQKELTVTGSGHIRIPLGPFSARILTEFKP